MPSHATVSTTQEKLFTSISVSSQSPGINLGILVLYRKNLFKVNHKVYADSWDTGWKNVIKKENKIFDNFNESKYFLTLIPSLSEAKFKMYSPSGDPRRD